MKLNRRQKTSLSNCYNISVKGCTKCIVQFIDYFRFHAVMFSQGHRVHGCWIFCKPSIHYAYQVIITLFSLHVSALLDHHQVTNVYNYDIKFVYISHLMMVQKGRNM
jgi:hypothetical protein